MSKLTSKCLVSFVLLMLFGFATSARATTYDWLSFIGGSGSDNGYGITHDTSGNVYLTGVSTATWGSPIREYTAGNDVFVAKFNSSGALVWNTFLGGSGVDEGCSIVIDSSGNIYINAKSTAT